MIHYLICLGYVMLGLLVVSGFAAICIGLEAVITKRVPARVRRVVGNICIALLFILMLVSLFVFLPLALCDAIK